MILYIKKLLKQTFTLTNAIKLTTFCNKLILSHVMGMCWPARPAIRTRKTQDESGEI